MSTSPRRLWLIAWALLAATAIALPPAAQAAPAPATPAAAAAVPAPSGGAQVSLILPLKRTSYQTNETIALAIVRQDQAALPAATLQLTITGDDGSKATLAFGVPAVALENGQAIATEHLHLDARLLRPGSYDVEATIAAAGAAAGAGGASGAGVASGGAKTRLEIFSHIRRSSYRLIDWGGTAAGSQLVALGEDGMGFNLFMGAAKDPANDSLRGGMDFMSCCTMSGGHQMDLRLECDWSDPLVVYGGAQRVAHRALIDRTRGNAVGVHFYDEPGLTWGKDPKSGEFGPHVIAPEHRAFRDAYDQNVPYYKELDPSKPEQLALWLKYATFKLRFMDAAWKISEFAVNQVDPAMLGITQSQYGWSAYGDGYYFNVVRSLPVVSGHGGYHDYGPGYFNPSLFLELSRARDRARPTWYLPTWYHNTSADAYRAEQYLSFQTNLAGMACPPPLEPKNPTLASAAPAIAETNKLMARLGTIFTVMPVQNEPVAMLYSMSNLLQEQAGDRSLNYAHATEHGMALSQIYLAGKLLQMQFMTVVDEDVIDGTLAANHKVVFLPAIKHLDPAVSAGLEQFIAAGGKVITVGAGQLKIAGAGDAGPLAPLPGAARIEQLTKELAKTDLSADVRKQLFAEQRELSSMRHMFTAARTLAKTIAPQLQQAGVTPIFGSDQDLIVATRQSQGDIEYLFAVNASHDVAGDSMTGLSAVTANLRLPGDRPVYDAVFGGTPVELKSKGSDLQGRIRFGPGAMRVFARTARPIGAIKLGSPVVVRDSTVTAAPIRLQLSAALMDNKGGLLAGAAPLHLRVIDPTGACRYDLYRALGNGLCQLELPLAANDPPGKWTVTVTELLSNTTDTSSFEYRTAPVCGALGGQTPRAVHLVADRENIFRFFRNQQAVTLVTGSGEGQQAAAARLSGILKTWGVQATTVDAATAGKARTLTEEEAKTWVGLNYAGSGVIKPGEANPPNLVGFAVRGPVILLGSPADNPIIAFLEKNQYLPYPVKAQEFPGVGRGLIAWQRGAVGHEQESIALVAYDAAGLSEAVGTLYELLAGMDPLTTWSQPLQSTLNPALKNLSVPPLTLRWSARLPDRALALSSVEGKLTALTADGSLCTLDGSGKINSTKELAPQDAAGRAELEKRLAAGQGLATAAQAKTYVQAGKQLKFVAAGKDLTAVAYWGGLVQIRDAQGKVLQSTQFDDDITGITWMDKDLAIGLSNGQIVSGR